MKKINFKKILIAVFIGVGFVSAGNVEAKTAKWISSSMPQLYYYATPSLQSQELLSAYGGQEADTSDPGSGWFPLVTNGKLEVGYSAYVWIKPAGGDTFVKVEQDDNGDVGAALKAGDVIMFTNPRPIQHQSRMKRGTHSGENAYISLTGTPTNISVEGEWNDNGPWGGSEGEGVEWAMITSSTNYWGTYGTFYSNANYPADDPVIDNYPGASGRPTVSPINFDPYWNIVYYGKEPNFGPYNWIGNTHFAIQTHYAQGGWEGYNFLYITPSVHLPTVTTSFTGTATLDCNMNYHAPYGGRCNVVSPGTLKMAWNISSTYAKFYSHSELHIRPQGKYAYLNAFTDDGSWLVNNPRDNGPWLVTSDQTMNPYVLNIPAQTIEFNFGAGNPPTPPMITGPTTGVPNTTYNFTLNSTDPDGDTIRYEIDWGTNSQTNTVLDAVRDSCSPANCTSLLASGTDGPWSGNWPTTGTHRFQARALDSTGLSSSWTQHAISLSTSQTIDPPTIVDRNDKDGGNPPNEPPPGECIVASEFMFSGATGSQTYRYQVDQGTGYGPGTYPSGGTPATSPVFVDWDIDNGISIKKFRVWIVDTAAGTNSLATEQVVDVNISQCTAVAEDPGVTMWIKGPPPANARLSERAIRVGQNALIEWEPINGASLDYCDLEIELNNAYLGTEQLEEDVTYYNLTNAQRGRYEFTLVCSVVNGASSLSATAPNGENTLIVNVTQATLNEI